MYNIYVITVCPDVSRYCIVLGMVVVIDHHVSEHLQTARAIFYRGIVVGCPFLVIFYLAGCLHADAVVLTLLRLYADNRPDFCIVLGTRRGNDIHAFDVGGLQPLQFVGVLYFFVVDVDFRCTFGKDGEVTVATLYLWQHRQHIVSRTDILQQRVLNIDGHASRGHLILWTFALHHHFTQLFRVGLHLDIAHISSPCIEILCRISNACHFQQTILYVGADAECSVVLGHGSCDESGIGTVDEYNISKRHRLRLLVNHTPANALCGRCYRHEAYH